MTQHYEIDKRWLDHSHETLQPFQAFLEKDAFTRGLMGPRERDRLWERHLRNSAVVVDPNLNIVPEGALVADIGSGAGLPGLVWAIIRPDISVIPIEPLERRVAFLQDAVDELGLTNVKIVRGRAMDIPSVQADIVTSRAVAPLPKLVPWSLHHLGKGRIIAMKGANVEKEIATHHTLLRHMDVDTATLGGTSDNPYARILLIGRDNG